MAVPAGLLGGFVAPPLLIWGILVGGGLFLIAVKPLQHRQAEEGEG
ncbi:hypothetical protein RAO22_03975 [Pediococcus acidilactici]